MIQETILVTGGCGFIGCNFIRMILAEHRDVKVVNLDALTYAGHPMNLAGCEDDENYTFVRGDIRDGELVPDLLEKHNIGGIINFAAESHVDRSIEEPNIFVETNVGGTLNLLLASIDAGVKRFLQVSTDEVYGSLEPEDAPFSETTPLCPNSPYAASKTAADHLVHAFHHTYGLDTVITRCSNNYGPYQFPEKMLPLMFSSARHDKPLPVYGDGMQVRDWLYVADHCSAIWAAFTRGGTDEVYNVGGCNEKTNLEVIRAILDWLGKPESLIEHVKDRPGHDRRYAMDARKIMGELGWKPEVTFEEGLRLTLDWYSQNQEWIGNVTRRRIQGVLL